MYKDNELYEINIDKLAYSLENNTNISVNDYINSTEAKIKREDWPSKKDGVKQALSKLYDAVRNGSFEAVKRQMKRFENNITEAKIKKVIEFVDKTKFVNGLIKYIENEGRATAADKECEILTIDMRLLKEIFKDAEREVTQSSGYTSKSGYTYSYGTVQKVNYAVDGAIATFKGGFIAGLFFEKKYKNSYFKVRWSHRNSNERYRVLSIIPKFKIKD